MPHFEWLRPEDPEKLAEWDAFVTSSPRGFYCQLSTWLGSLRAYHFDYVVLVARETAGSRIVGGIGLYTFGNRFFRLMSAPVGPIIEVGYEDLTGPVLSEVYTGARLRGAAFLQMQFPCSSEPVTPLLLPEVPLPEPASAMEGLAWKSGNVPNQMLWIEYPEDGDEAWRDRMLDSFDARTRRNIRTAERNGLVLVEATSEKAIREAYRIIELHCCPR